MLDRFKSRCFFGVCVLVYSCSFLFFFVLFLFFFCSFFVLPDGAISKRQKTTRSHVLFFLFWRSFLHLQIFQAGTSLVCDSLWGTFPHASISIFSSQWHSAINCFWEYGWNYLFKCCWTSIKLNYSWSVGEHVKRRGEERNI